MAEYISNETKAIKVGQIIPDIKAKQKGKNENMENKIEIEVETKGIDEMNEKLEKAKNNAEDLAEALEIPSIIIKQSKNCTFNISINR